MFWDPPGVTVGTLFALSFKTFSKCFLGDFLDAFLVEKDVQNEIKMG